MTTEVPQNLPPAPPGAPDDLWAWSLRVYARDGFAPAALRLQDRAGLDVNLLLWCLWAGVVRHADVGAAGVAAAAAAAGRWQAEVVRPLRAARRALKGLPHPDPALVAGLRERVAAEELAAERGEHALLAAVPLAGQAADPAAAAARNLVHYSRWTGLDPGATADADLALLLAAATGSPAAALLAAARAELSPA